MNEVRQREISYEILYMWNIIGNYTSELTKHKQTCVLRERTYGCQGKNEKR